MIYLNLPSFSLLKKNVEIINASKRINDLLIQKSLFICSGKIWRSIGILFLLIYNSDLSFAQTMGGLHTEVISNCVISPTTPVCPNAVTTYSAPTGMTSYAWSITGAGYITGPVNGRTIKVTSGSNCNTSYKLTITYTNALITSTCIQAIPIVDNKLPTIVAAASKSVPSNTTNVVFDNPTMNDACGTPVLIVLSTTSVTNPSGSVSYTRTWKAIDVCDNSSATCSQTVTVNSALPCSITGNSTICQNGSTELCATAGATSYLWNTGATTQCINITSAGTYSVIIVEAGVASNCSKIVTIGSQSNCLISGNGSICTNGASNLCAPAGADSYLWSN